MTPPFDPVDAEECYAVPGENHIIDVINPETGLTWVNAHTEAQIREREPKAERMRFSEWLAAKAARQQAVPIRWTPVSKAIYDRMLEVLPPLDWNGESFLVGEADDHCAATGAPRYRAFRKRGSHFFEIYETASRPLTRKEFKEHK